MSQKRYSDELKAAAVEYSKTNTNADTAKKFEVSTDTLRKWRNEAGVERKLPNKSEAMMEAIKLVKQGATQAQAARLTGVSGAGLSEAINHRVGRPQKAGLHPALVAMGVNL